MVDRFFKNLKINIIFVKIHFTLFFPFISRRKKEREREQEEADTRNSSPGGWQGRLSAFLHVHRGSRASSRKSSRASDASDLSELGGPWLNLPLLLLSSATNMDPEELDLKRDASDIVSIKVNEATPDKEKRIVSSTEKY